MTEESMVNTPSEESNEVIAPRVMRVIEVESDASEEEVIAYKPKAAPKTVKKSNVAHDPWLMDFGLDNLSVFPES